jgi:hypothetical protein
MKLHLGLIARANMPATAGAPTGSQYGASATLLWHSWIAAQPPIYLGRPSSSDRDRQPQSQQLNRFIKLHLNSASESLIH